MSKKSKILCIILVLVFIAAVISTGIRGLNVDLSYSSGASLVFDLKQEFNTADVKALAQEVWPEGQIIVQKVEVYDQSVLIKVSGQTTEELESLLEKVNEKYELELTTDDVTILSNTNYRLRDIIRPYIVPVIIATALVVVYYSIRYKGVKEILKLLLVILAVEGIIYSIYALVQIPVDFMTMPIAMIAYVLTIVAVTIRNERKV